MARNDEERRGQKDTACRAWGALALTLSMVFSGCASTPSAERAPLEIVPEVIDERGAIRDGAAETMTPQAFLTLVSRAAASGATGAATRVVRRYPDLARTCLCRAEDETANNTGDLDLIALLHDEVCGSSVASFSWQAWRRDRRRHPARYADFDADRAAVTTALLAGRARVAVDIELEPPADSPAATLLSIEARRLQGIALRRCGRTAEAIVEWEAALDFARRSLPYEHACLALSLCAAALEQQALDTAAKSWAEAVTAASELARRQVIDPSLWERALDLKPADVSWPLPARAWIASRASREFGIDMLAELVTASPATGSRIAGASDVSAAQTRLQLLAIIAAVRLARGEPRAALLQLGTARATSPPARVDGRLRLLVAKSMVALGEVGQARAVLSALATGDDAGLAMAARALLGALELRLGNVEQGTSILERVVASGEASPREAIEAEANLALAYLMTGHEQRGLELLRSAQQRWRVARDWQALAQSLSNEVDYFERTGREQRAADARRRLADMQATSMRAR